MSSQKKHGPPKHQNTYAWKPNGGRKINETELGGRYKPFSEITGVCLRCREQIDWKRKYGKYKALSEPAKCQRCMKRNVRQAYHNLCQGCAKEHKICAKCCCRVDQIVGSDLEKIEAEQKMLQEALKNARERDKRAILRAMEKTKAKGSAKFKEDEEITRDANGDDNEDDGENDDEGEGEDDDTKVRN